MSRDTDLLIKGRDKEITTDILTGGYRSSSDGFATFQWAAEYIYTPNDGSGQHSTFNVDM